MQESRCFVKSFWVLHLRTFLLTFTQDRLVPDFLLVNASAIKSKHFYQHFSSLQIHLSTKFQTQQRTFAITKKLEA